MFRSAVAAASGQAGKAPEMVARNLKHREDKAQLRLHSEAAQIPRKHSYSVEGAENRGHQEEDSGNGKAGGTRKDARNSRRMTSTM